MTLSPLAPDISAVVLNTTVTDTTSTGHLSDAPDPNTLQQYLQNAASPPWQPSSSSLNWTAGATVPNLVQTAGGPDGIVDFWNAADGPSDLIVDMFGYYQND
ncbi:hypothetical protein [Kitasatospora sp. NBC_01266]|uniref:hypothetical protein n=1 Tax=Kitasatospora sp. NBC_01266 TaxID=2903572 RepID=UPI002E3732C3|nr:hypothetical protein [Kitasatospora sp. NBC_01266]